MAALAYGLWLGVERLTPGLPVPRLGRELLALALPVAAGAAFYAWGVTRLGVGEFAAIARGVRRRFGLARS
jgi:hypothetical protein